MATYQELHELQAYPGLLDRIEVAVVIAAIAIRDDGAPPANQAQRLAWAKAVLQSPRGEASKMLPIVLGDNAASPVATIQAATDAQLQTAVNASIDILAGS